MGHELLQFGGCFINDVVVNTICYEHSVVQLPAFHDFVASITAAEVAEAEFIRCYPAARGPQRHDPQQGLPVDG